MEAGAPSPAFRVLAALAAGLMALATARWGRRGAVAGYLIGLGLCIGAWIGAVFLTTRLDGMGGASLIPALGRGLAAVMLLASLWLVVASAGVVAGAVARLLWRRSRSRRAAPPLRRGVPAAPPTRPRRPRGR